MYGCVPPAIESETPKSFTRNLPRVLPMIMSKTFPAFSYPSCDFKVGVNQVCCGMSFLFSWWQCGVVRADFAEQSDYSPGSGLQ
jgi:hypothetical protein